jgi:hypothetical protein
MKEITAYKAKDYGEIKKGTTTRSWMDFTDYKFAYGCLPLIIANEMGWDIICQTSFKAIWNGNNDKDSIVIQYLDNDNPNNQQAVSHFGHGVLTFMPGFLFQTEKDHNLYVKGVPNLIKDSIQALEGVVETDWLPFTFTLNWRFTRPNTWVEFVKGEPVGRIMPYPRNYIEEFSPAIKHIETNEELSEAYKIWSRERHEKNESLKKEGVPYSVERKYFKGIHKDSKKVEFHQKKILLKDFNDNDQTKKQP